MKDILLIDDDKISNFINERIIKNAKVASDILVFNSAESALIHLEKKTIVNFLLKSSIR